jgi:hypothetical protein
MEFTIDVDILREKGIFIGIPMYGGLCYGSTTSSLMDLAALCARNNIPLRTYFLYNESLIQRARNYIADEFLRSEMNIFMFIDADIHFKPIDVLAMAHLQATNDDYGIVCGPYPKKCIAFEKIAKAVEKGYADEDPNNLENFVGDYVFNAVKNESVPLNQPFEVLESGTGFMMIKRESLELWRDSYPEMEYTPDHPRTSNFDGTRKIHAFFHCDIDADTNQYLSEDYFFCRKARKAGIKVWLFPWIELKHTGTYTFGGSLAHIAAIEEATSYKKKDKKS